MRRSLLILAVVLPLLGACDPVDTNKHNAPPKPPAGKAAAPANPGGAQPAPVQGDPSAHNTQPGEVDLHVEWASENSQTIVCEWSKNAPGQGHPCENMSKGHKEGQDYLGLWEYETTGKAGDVIFIAAQGTGAVKWVKCSVAWKGAYHEISGSGNRCAGTYTLS